MPAESFGEWGFCLTPRDKLFEERASQSAQVQYTSFSPNEISVLASQGPFLTHQGTVAAFELNSTSMYAFSAFH